MRTIEQIVEYIGQNKSQLQISLNAPAYISDIEDFESNSGIILPADIKKFYMLCNGFRCTEDLFNIIPLDEILSYKYELKVNEFYIAEYMIYSDAWVVNVNSDLNTYEIFENSFKTVLTNSFTEFLERFLTGGVFGKGGLYEWKNEIGK
jgi:hypothetical protein